MYHALVISITKIYNQFGNTVKKKSQEQRSDLGEEAKFCNKGVHYVLVKLRQRITNIYKRGLGHHLRKILHIREKIHLRAKCKPLYFESIILYVNQLGKAPTPLPADILVDSDA